MDVQFLTPGYNADNLIQLLQLLLMLHGRGVGYASSKTIISAVPGALVPVDFESFDFEADFG